MFIRGALVDGEFDTRSPFFAHNRKLLADIEQLEHKSRRQDVLVDDELIFAFYDQAAAARASTPARRSSAGIATRSAKSGSRKTSCACCICRATI